MRVHSNCSQPFSNNSDTPLSENCNNTSISFKLSSSQSLGSMLPYYSDEETVCFELPDQLHRHSDALCSIASRVLLDSGTRFCLASPKESRP